MADDSARERRFSEEEVALIIKRAAELQQTEQAAQEPGSSLSLSEIEQIAGEAGIDAGLVRRAALGLDRPVVTNRPSPWLGAPTRVVFEKVVEGELPVEQFEDIVTEVRRTIGANGLASVLGRSLAWSTSGAGGRRGPAHQVEVGVVVRGGTTTIRVEEEFRNLAGALLGGLVGGGGGGTTGGTIAIGMTLFHSAPATVALWVAVVGGFYSLARTIFGNIVRKRERELRGLADRLEEIVTAAVRKPHELPPGASLPALPNASSTGVTR